MLSRGATLDPEGEALIVPVLVGTKPDTFKPMSVYAAQAAIPRALRVLKHQRDLCIHRTDVSIAESCNALPLVRISNLLELPLACAS